MLGSAMLGYGMLGLAFLNPLLLWALPLAAIPIVIHILNRRRFKKVPWAAMEFLLKAMKRNRKRLRMEQWLVLLLRVLAVLLLVALVSRPQLGGGGLLGSRTHHVIVIDDSASMTQRSGSSNLFEKAQDRVRQLADDLAQRRSGDVFSIVRTSTPTAPDMWEQRVGPEFGRRAGALLKQLEVSDRATDLGAAFEATVKRAHEVEDASRTEYYLVGDRRAWDWATPDDRARPALLAALSSLAPDKEHVTVLTVGGQHQDLAVVDVRLEDRLAIAAVPVSLAVDVQNFGLDPTPPTTVGVEVDGQSRVVLDVPALAPGERKAVALTHTFHDAGAHRVEAKLEPSDAFAIDDGRALALDVRERSRVLLVDGEPDEDLGEVFFLQATLDVPESGIEAQVVTETGFDEANLDAFDLIWWCNVQAPTQQAAARLRAFVEGGGGVAITCGALVDATRYNELLYQDGEGLLPLPIGEIDGDPDRPERAALSMPEHAICAGLAEVFDLLLGNVVQVKRWLLLEEPAGHGAAIVARIKDAEGPPLLATKAFGGKGGQVSLFAVTADRFWTNLPSTDLFLVLTHQLHRFAARRDDPSRNNLRSDGSFRVELDPGTHRADVVMRAISGEDERTFTAVAPPAAAANDGAGGSEGAPPASATLVATIELRELRTLGVYEVGLQRHDGVPDTRLMARNLPVEEGRLVGFTEPAFGRLYPSNLHDRVTFVRDETGAGAAASEGEAWPLLAMLLLVGLLAESLLAWRFGRR